MQQPASQRVRTLALLVALVLSGATPAASAAGPPGVHGSSAGQWTLQQALEQLVERFPGQAGVAVRHLDTGLSAEVDAQRPYPMASTYKVPILVEMMARIEAGELSMDTEIELQPSDQHIGSGLLQDLWAPGLKLSLRNLATMMIILSDNSATDMLIDRLGAGAITARMGSLGYDAIRVDRTTLELILDYLGVPYEGLEEADGPRIREALAAYDLDGEQARTAAEAFYDDGLDTSSARQMTDLLVRIAREEILTPASCAAIIEILERTQTGANRLRGLLPPGITLAHKTGTIGRVVNDVGVIWLPEDLGRFAISVYTLADGGVDSTVNERLIADLARTSYDYFLFHTE